MPSTKTDLTGVPATMSSYRPVFVNVSDLYLFSSAEDKSDSEISSKTSGKSGYGWLYVTDARDNNPISGAQVVAKNIAYGRDRGATTTLRSDSQGRVAIPYQNASMTVTHKGQRLTWSTYCSQSERKMSDNLAAEVFTDLGIYHPGDSVQAAVVVAKSHDNLLAPADAVKVTLQLMDANWKEVAKQVLTTDSFGRASAAFKLPSKDSPAHSACWPSMRRQTASVRPVSRWLTINPRVSQ